MMETESVIVNGINSEPEEKENLDLNEKSSVENAYEENEIPSDLRPLKDKVNDVNIIDDEIIMKDETRNSNKDEEDDVDSEKSEENIINVNGDNTASDIEDKDVTVSSFTLSNGDVLDVKELSSASNLIGLKLFEFLEDRFIKTKDYVSPFQKTVANKHAAQVSNLQQQVDNLKQINKNLKESNDQLQTDLNVSVQTLKDHDIAAKRAIARMRNDFEATMKEVNKKCTTLEAERQSSVMTYARREKELLDLRKKKDHAENYARNSDKRRDDAIAQMKVIKADMVKYKTVADKKDSENSSSKSEIEKLKEEINSQTIKVRWAQNKLKSETDAHKETKEKCDKMVLEIQHAKEETEQIRKNCQDMIKTYQESEEIQSNALDIELKEKVLELSANVAESEEVKEVLKKRNEELSMLKTQHKDTLEESKVLKSRIECLDEERKKNKAVLQGYEEVMNKQKINASQMNEKLVSLEQLEHQLNAAVSENDRLRADLESSGESRSNALSDLELKEKKEQELLEYTQRVSTKNTELTVKVEELDSKLKTNSTDIESYRLKIADLEIKTNDLRILREKETSAASLLQEETTKRLQEKEKTICNLLVQLDDLKDDMRTVKRKQAAAVKDLTRQLNQAKKKMDNVDTVSVLSGGHNSHSNDGGSMGSRTSSTTSLDRINSYNAEAHNSVNNHHNLYDNAVAVPETTVTTSSSMDRQMLIERIVRLQQIHAKKNEKIDFLNDHVQRLIANLQKKQRLIQHYIMREESGALAPARPLQNRSKSGLTLELSMEINQKMQSVLEDTILKNITLKESLEILAKENQQLVNR